MKTRFFVEQGSVYAPGWHVLEQVRDNHQVSRARFDEKADAYAYCAELLEAELAEVKRQLEWEAGK